MSDFASSYVGKLREIVGNQVLLIPGTRVVIERTDGCILLQKRSDFGVWGLLGGNAEPGESLEQVIAREVKEEAGIDIRDVQPIGFGSNPELETFTFPNGHVAQHFVMNFFCRDFSGQPTVRDDESLALGWFQMDDLPEMLPNMSESVRAYQRFRSTGQFQLF